VRLLLDTQVALWWLTASPKLSASTRRQMAGSACAVSVASLWEVAIKHRLKKLTISPSRFRDELVKAGASVLSITDEHVLATGAVPEAHEDPFDRLLLAVAETEHLVLLTADASLLDLARSSPRLPIRGA
jgi:PIN domain nuclease of toxin-antitoxin system